MTIRGTVVNGVVVPDGGETLPEGARVEIFIPELKQEAAGQAPESLSELLARFAGCMEGLPADMAAQHNHYSMASRSDERRLRSITVKVVNARVERVGVAWPNAACNLTGLCCVAGHSKASSP